MKFSKSFSKWIGPVVLPVALALTALQPGCLLGSNGPSAVGQGQEYRSGDPTYDQFFADLHELQVEMSRAPKEEKEHRIALATKLGLEIEEEPVAAAPAAPSPAPATSPTTPAAAQQPSMGDALGQSAMSSIPGLAQVNQVKNQVNQVKGQVDAIKQQANQLGSLANGVSASTQPAAPTAAAKPEPRAPSASLMARTIKRKAETLSLQLALAIDDKALEQNEVKTELRSAPESLDGDGKKLAEALHEAARSELKMYLKMQQAKDDLAKLAALATSLDASVDAVFKRGGISKKSEVRKNLEDARAMIKLMQARADDVSNKAKEVVDKLEEVASAKIEPPAVAEELETDGVAKQQEPAAEPAAKQTKTDAAQPVAEPAKKEATKSKPAKSSAAPAASKPRPAARPVADFEP